MGLNDVKISVKLIVGFLIVAVIALAIGVVGYVSVNSVNAANDEIGGVRMPSIQSLLIISEAQTAIDAGENSLLAVDNDKAGRDAAYQRFDDAKKRIEDARKIYDPLPQTKEEEQVWKEFVPAWDAYMKDHEKVVELSKAYWAERDAGKSIEEAMKTYDPFTEYALVTIGVSFSKAESLLNKVVEINDVEAVRVIDEATKTSNNAKMMVIIFVIVGVLIAIGLALFITRMITKPINTIANEAKKLAETGDLTMRATVMGKDEVGQMAVALNTMLDNTAGPVKELSAIAATIAAGDLTAKVNVQAKGDIVKLIDAFKTMVDNLQRLIGNIKKNAAAAATSAEELSASSEEVNASMEQVSSTVQEVAKGAQNTSKGATEAQGAAKKTGESSQAGSKSAREVDAKMGVISTTTKESAEKIKLLGQKSKEIGKIVDTIKNISEQTNLLALNAAIEAARAGDAGRGFAVVADEVRKLAEESGKATGQISDLIGGIQTEIQSSVEGMDRNVKEVAAGAASVKEAMASFEAIPHLVEEVNKTLAEMSAVAQENAAGAEEVSSSVEQVTSSMQQVSSAAQTLSAGAEELKHMVAKFKIDEIEEAQEAVKPQAKKIEEAKQVNHKPIIKK